MLPVPLLSSCTVRGPLHSATGTILSCIVTVVVQFELFPFTSVTVSVTVIVVPASLHVKVFGDTSMPCMMQLSKLPPSISDTWILALPLLSSCTVNGPLHNATGAILSCTVTVALHVDTLPFTSITVSVTVLAFPASLHVKVFGDTSIVAIPQASVLPASICEVWILVFPLLSSGIVIDRK